MLHFSRFESGVLVPTYNPFLGPNVPPSQSGVVYLAGYSPGVYVMKLFRFLVKTLLSFGGIDRSFLVGRAVEWLYPGSRISPKAVWLVDGPLRRQIKVGTSVIVSAFTTIVAKRDALAAGLDCSIVIGDNTYVGEFNNIRASGGGIRIGSHVLISQHVSLIASNHSTSPSASVDGQAWRRDKVGVIVEDDVWIGCNSVILPGVTLGKGCIVAAGSVVTKSVPEMTIVAGNPAKVLKTR